MELCPIRACTNKTTRWTLDPNYVCKYDCKNYCFLSPLRLHYNPIISPLCLHDVPIMSFSLFFAVCPQNVCNVRIMSAKWPHYDCIMTTFCTQNVYIMSAEWPLIDRKMFTKCLQNVLIMTSLCPHNVHKMTPCPPNDHIMAASWHHCKNYCFLSLL